MRSDRPTPAIQISHYAPGVRPAQVSRWSRRAISCGAKTTVTVAGTRPHPRRGGRSVAEDPAGPRRPPPQGVRQRRGVLAARKKPPGGHRQEAVGRSGATRDLGRTAPDAPTATLDGHPRRGRRRDEHNGGETTKVARQSGGPQVRNRASRTGQMVPRGRWKPATAAWCRRQVVRPETDARPSGAPRGPYGRLDARSSVRGSETLMGTAFFW